MPRDDRPHDDRHHHDRGPRDDYGQADDSDRYGYDPQTRSGRPGPYGSEWAYDPERGRPIGREIDRSAPSRAEDRDRPSRSWMSRAGDMFAGGGEARAYDDRYGQNSEPVGRAPARRRGPSDRVLFAVISERLETQRRLDLSDVQLHVLNSEVTLEGTVRHKGDRRLIEDIADIDGVHHVR